MGNDIRFICWKCHEKLAVDISGSGLSVPCPLCSQQIIIPDWKGAIDNANSSIRQLASSNQGHEIGGLAAQVKAKFHYDGYVCLDDYRNTPADFGTYKRIELVIRINIGLRRGFKRWQEQMDDDIVSMWPAWALVLQTGSQRPRRITSRWKASGGKSRNGEYVALKTDLVWSEFSVFGCPWPPFDLYDDVRVRHVATDEARELGFPKHNQVQGQNKDVKNLPYLLLEDESVTKYFEKNSCE